MRFSIIATSFAALAASTPISAPLAKRTGLDAVPFGVLSHIPYFPWDSLSIDYSKLGQGASIADLAKLPVDVSSLAQVPIPYLGANTQVDISGAIQKALSVANQFNVPINPLSVPQKVKDVLGSYTGDAAIDATKLPIDVSKLPAYTAKAASSTTKSSYTKRTFADIPGLNTFLGYFGFGNLPALFDSYFEKGISSFFKVDISKESKAELSGAADKIVTILGGLVNSNSALYKEINAGSSYNTTSSGSKYGARDDGSPAFTITAKQVSDFINFIVAIAIKVGVASAKAIGSSGAF